MYRVAFFIATGQCVDRYVLPPWFEFRRELVPEELADSHMS
jgi:hypothetical protein